MRYLGGKSKISKRLSACILASTMHRKRLIEPFMGSCSMTAALSPHFETVEASDINADLVLLWQALRDGWSPPVEISQSDYEKLRTAPPSALKAFAGFGTSWGGKWFGGYARGDNRNYAAESSRSLTRDIKRMLNCSFSCSDYKSLRPLSSDVVYADPPYEGTTEYRDGFNSVEFWEVMKSWTTSGTLVFVSEYAAPLDWSCIWSMERTRDMRSDLKTAEKVTEKLFTYRLPFKDLEKPHDPRCP